MSSPVRRSAAKPTRLPETAAPAPPVRAPLIDLPRLRHAEPAQRRRLLAVSITTALWFGFTVWASSYWFSALADTIGLVAATFFIGGLALVPSAMNVFIVASLLLDRRPPRRALARYPALSVLMYVRDQAQSIAQTIESIRRQEYPGPFEVILIDDASTDRTAQIVHDIGYRWIKVLRQSRNRGKAAALNRALEAAQHDLIVTLDADAILFGDALWSMVERYLTAEPDVRAISGCVLVRNSRDNWLTRAQEWDYFHGLAAMKRMQSQYQGTVVAEASFTIYDRVALKELGGWRSDVAEDVLLTWDMLQKGWRVGFAEDACCFIIVPADVKSFLEQRMRQARVTLRALTELPGELIKRRTSMLFVVWHLLFPWTDLAFTLGFVPGVILSAAFSSHLLMGPMALTLLPAALLLNVVIFFVMRSMFNDHRLKIRRNVGGLLVYVFGYSLLLQPARVAGYLAGLVRRSPSTSAPAE
ncbi:MAG TPA: glycosyltransferase [Burkholderiaceae bacterium]|nr:glycosyltransferase [Burkholderiaceae bacterium]